MNNNLENNELVKKWKSTKYKMTNPSNKYPNDAFGKSEWLTIHSFRMTK